MNTPYILDFSSFANALRQLQKSLVFLESDLAQDKNIYEQFRAATIQAFEYCYELSHKSLKRFLQVKTPSSDIIDSMSFPEMIRTAYEKGLVKNSWSLWQEYRDARNKTSHAYDETVADKVLEIIPLFLEEALYLYNKLETNKDA
jgi:nucleotidyltransferase substrate binding protein (TIGR01987 family)